jgi:hypothetical protein
MTEEHEVETRDREVSWREGSLASGIKVLIWLVSILIVLSAGNFIRSYYVQDSVDKATHAGELAIIASENAKDTSVEGRDASLETLAELRAILARIEDQNTAEPDLQNQAILDALQAIARIEAFICEGPCPVPE